MNVISEEQRVRNEGVLLYNDGEDVYSAVSSDSRQWKNICGNVYTVIVNIICKTEGVSGPSHTSEDECDTSLHSDESKLRLKNAILYMEKLLLENDLVAQESSRTISRQYKLAKNCMNASLKY